VGCVGDCGQEQRKTEDCVERTSKEEGTEQQGWEIDGEGGMEQEAE